MANPKDEEQLQEIHEQLGEVRRVLETQSDRDRVREKAFDQLYEELRQYKDDFLFQAEKPLLLDLLLFYDSLNWFQESLIRQDMSAEVIADSFQYLVDEFLEVLYRRDVVPMEPADVFDRKIHKAVKVLETEVPSQDYRVAQVLKRGFSRAEKLLRAEEVVIHRLRRSKES